jgi:hypothetical protein
MRRVTLVGLVAMLVVTPFAAAPVSLARFTAAATATASVATGSLAAPTLLAGAGGTTTSSLTWTPSTSGAAAGYLVLRSGTSGAGYTQVGTVTPVSAAATTDTPGNGTWYYILRTYLQSWTSSPSNEASVVIAAATSTGYLGCQNNAAETNNAGDNNGYQSGAGNACALDGSVATDTNSGNGTNASCSSNQKDRHRFWGYSFGLPASVTSIDGITLRMAAGIDATTGTNSTCVQLSWNSGATWTAARSVNITGTGITTYTLGGPADLWGQPSWSLAQLGTSTFRIRITNVSDNNSRDFRLDYLGVQVNYTP